MSQMTAPTLQKAQSQEANTVLLTQGGTKSDLGHNNVIAAGAENSQKMIYTTLENV